MQEGTETIEVNVDEFAARYALTLTNKVPVEEEAQLLEIASACMQSPDLDEETRDFFHSAFLVMSKKNKKFIDLRKMNRMIRNGELKRPVV